jgi:hypothetical protein
MVEVHVGPVEVCSLDFDNDCLASLVVPSDCSGLFWECSAVISLCPV